MMPLDETRSEAGGDAQAHVAPVLRVRETVQWSGDGEDVQRSVPVGATATTATGEAEAVTPLPSPTALATPVAFAPWWLDVHGPSVQAVATALSVVFTAILVLVTIRYVRLTSRLATSAEAQIGQWKRERDARRMRFLSNIAALRKHLAKLPTDLAAGQPSAIKALEGATLWTDDDIAEIKRFGGEFAKLSLNRMAEVTTHLQWLRQRISSGQSNKGGMGFNWNAEDWEELFEKVEDADRLLLDLHEIVASDATQDGR